MLREIACAFMCGCVMSRVMAAEPIGILIQRARQRKHLTQAQVAEALGVDRAAVSRWESGEHFPARNAGALEELLEITIPAPEQVTA